MEIKKGERFKCIKDLGKFYTNERIYESDQDGCITDNDGNKGHYWVNLKDLEGNICFETVSDSHTSPSHYKAYDIEAIEMMIRIWGKQRVAEWCEITAFKYRCRVGMKDDVQQDLKKEAYYLGKWKELRDGE